jgi:hypothetical protein
MKKQDVLRVKDGILNAILATIARDQVFNRNLVFQGGGALHFIYGSPRYSNDLDFVCENLEAVQGEIVEALQRGVSADGRRLIPLIKSDGKLVRAAYSFGENQPSGKLEIYAQGSFDNQPTSGKFSPLRVESPSEIYADKVIATLARMSQRGSLKPTDLFDLDYISTNLTCGVTAEDLRRKAASYGELKNVSPKMLERVAVYVQDPTRHDGFRATIGKSLMPDYFEHARMDTAFFDRVGSEFRKHADQVRAS